MPWVKRSIAVLCLILVTVAALCFHHYLPRHKVVHITGVEVKRMDADGVINAENPADGPTRDVYFINTVSSDADREVVVYRNEDTGWGFPWYFKFDSADLQAKAQDYSRDQSQLAVIRYYGWRFQIFSMFPNITDLKATTSRSEPFPVFNTIFFSVLLIVAVTVGLVIRRRLRLKRAPMVPSDSSR
ncbi:DUF1523 family protein [Pseudomonas sp. 5P_5.1_Bac1]|uniref:DUF1523 family protein n=1 Tax=Pseudomonas sp. 5P_5.1_Bac1 TaxID=2971616 RepID=UPI0021C99115|nr:DUF1523 family protein [Pseudomonas sp. 5P_5.1_Bac1]MCU1725076.1 DUF1523 family protein [Pseudomonas sp. 5P_5.1_Bac1]